MKKNEPVEVEVVNEAPTTALAVAEAEICQWLNAGKCENAQGPTGMDCLGLRNCRFGRSNRAAAMPTTIQVRRHKHLVNLPVEQALTQQYERVSRVSNAALREMVIFGAMLDRIDQALTTSRHNPDGSGMSLKSWLAEKCPTIDYATAMDYKRTMKNFLAYMKLKEDTPLLEMMNVDCYDDAKKEALRRNVLDTISHMTKYKLRQITDKKDKPGNTQATGRKEVTAVERAARAAADAVELVGSLHAFCFSGSSLELMTEQELATFAHELKVCASRVEDEILKK